MKDNRPMHSTPLPTRPSAKAFAWTVGLSVGLTIGLVAAVPAWAQERTALTPVARVATTEKVAPAAAAKPAKGAKASAAASAKSCSWDRPGKDPYMGELPAAIDRYTDLPADVRAKLKDRIAKQQYDDLVVIKRDSIEGGGNFVYASDIRGMHFGSKGRVCDSVTRKNWKPTMTERGLVYCEAGQCVLVPTVCRNVSRVSRKPNDVAAAKAATPTAAAPGAAPAVPAAAGPVVAKADPSPVVGAVPAAAPVAPAFTDVAVGPVFAFPGGPSGNSGVTIVAPTGGAGATPGGGAAPGTPGSPATPTQPGVIGTPTDITGTTPTTPVTPGGSVSTTGVVTPVPEPSTWALMLGGLLAVVWMARRRAAKA
jgi:hypothetical protein